jgi:anti-sigma factor RsiW
MNPNPINNRDCAGIAPLLPRLADGDLSLAEQAAMEAHLGECFRCRDEAGALLAVGTQLRHCAPSPAHLPSGAAVAERIRELERRRPLFGLSSLLPRAAWGGLAAASLAGLVLAAALHHFGSLSREGEPRVSAPARTAAAPVLFLVDDETSGRRVVLSSGRGARP